VTSTSEWLGSKTRGEKLSYDADGDLTSDGTNEYTWNARISRLGTVSSIDTECAQFSHGASAGAPLICLALR
jgi:hypothetical protein